MSRGSGIHLPRSRGRPAGRQFRIFEREVWDSVMEMLWRRCRSASAMASLCLRTGEWAPVKAHLRLQTGATLSRQRGPPRSGVLEQQQPCPNIIDHVRDDFYDKMHSRSMPFASPHPMVCPLAEASVQANTTLIQRGPRTLVRQYSSRTVRSILARRLRGHSQLPYLCFNIFPADGTLASNFKLLPGPRSFPMLLQCFPSPVLFRAPDVWDLGVGHLHPSSVLCAPSLQAHLS